MLVLSRHRDESVIIGDDIIVTVVDIRGDKVRLGFTAPIEVSVHRTEVYEKIQREKRGLDINTRLGYGVNRPTTYYEREYDVRQTGYSGPGNLEADDRIGERSDQDYPDTGY